MFVCVCLSAFVCLCVCDYVCVYVDVCVLVCLLVCARVNKFEERETASKIYSRERERENNLVNYVSFSPDL